VGVELISGTVHLLKQISLPVRSLLLCSVQLVLRR
jgi:hypothetical protein